MPYLPYGATRYGAFDDRVFSPPTDIALRHVDPSLEESERAAKRRRITDLARSYLQGNSLHISTAALRGPFEGGWKNPWKKYVKDCSIPATEQSQELREEVQRRRQESKERKKVKDRKKRRRRKARAEDSATATVDEPASFERHQAVHHSLHANDEEAHIHLPPPQVREKYPPGLGNIALNQGSDNIGIASRTPDPDLDNSAAFDFPLEQPEGALSSSQLTTPPETDSASEKTRERILRRSSKNAQRDICGLETTRGCKRKSTTSSKQAISTGGLETSPDHTICAANVEISNQVVEKPDDNFPKPQVITRIPKVGFLRKKGLSTGSPAGGTHYALNTAEYEDEIEDNSEDENEADSRPRCRAQAPSTAKLSRLKRLERPSPVRTNQKKNARKSKKGHLVVFNQLELSHRTKSTSSGLAVLSSDHLVNIESLQHSLVDSWQHPILINQSTEETLQRTHQDNTASEGTSWSAASGAFAQNPNAYTVSAASDVHETTENVSSKTAYMLAQQALLDPLRSHLKDDGLFPLCSPEVQPQIPAVVDSITPFKDFNLRVRKSLSSSKTLSGTRTEQHLPSKQALFDALSSSTFSTVAKPRSQKRTAFVNELELTSGDHTNAADREEWPGEVQSPTLLKSLRRSTASQPILKSPHEPPRLTSSPSHRKQRLVNFDMTAFSISSSGTAQEYSAEPAKQTSQEGQGLFLDDPDFDVGAAIEEAGSFLKSWNVESELRSLQAGSIAQGSRKSGSYQQSTRSALKGSN